MKGLALFFLSIVSMVSAAEGHRQHIYTTKKYRANIHFSANDVAFLYLNGVKRAKAESWNRARFLRLYVKEGDVIAFKAINKHGWYGFIANIEINGTHYPTGGKGWKATHGGITGKAWKKSKRGFCWHVPMLVPRRRYQPCQNFPSRFKAKYVWACHSTPGIRSVTLLRFVVGGDECESRPIPSALPTSTATPTVTPTPTVTSTPTPTPSPTLSYIDGAGGKDGGMSCTCESVPNSSSRCYYFLDSTVKYGRCSHRPCADRYVCVANGSTICVKKFVLEKLLPLPETGNSECTVVETRDPIWLPYESQ